MKCEKPLSDALTQGLNAVAIGVSAGMLHLGLASAHESATAVAAVTGRRMRVERRGLFWRVTTATR
jgi:hypothetical protein